MRCNNINDCLDKSDKAYCTKLHFDNTYQKYIVPHPLGEESRANVTVKMELINLRKIDEVDGSFQMQLFLTLKWFDSRLQYINLKDNFDLNNFLPSENKLIWIPELVFENTEDKMRSKINEKTSIKVLKTGNFTPSYISENENIQIFRGDENMLIMRQFYTLTFLSDFKMAWYPFDLQELKMHLTMDSGFAPFVMFNLEEVVYNGKELLTKYEVQDVEMFITEWENKEAITYEIILG